MRTTRAGRRARLWIWIWICICLPVALLSPLAPTPSHLAMVIDLARSEKVGLVVSRPASIDVARKVAREVGAQARSLDYTSTTLGATRGNLAFMDNLVETFANHLRKP